MLLPRARYLVPILAAALPIGGLLAVFLLSEWKLRAHDRPPPFDREIPVTVEAFAQGEHIARTRGCHSCHGARLEGTDWTPEWTGLGRVVAPNLARYAREHDAATIERAVRHGIDASGRGLWSMPSFNFRYLRDDDLVALISYLRQHPVSADSLPLRYHTLETRWAQVARGEADQASWVHLVPPLLTEAGRDGPLLAEGEYLAMTSCIECHGFDLRGAIEGPNVTPDLAVVATYSRQEFERLMREGISRTGNADLVLMSKTARNRFVHWTGAEVDALYAFLGTLPARPVPTGVFWRAGP